MLRSVMTRVPGNILLFLLSVNQNSFVLQCDNTLSNTYLQHMQHFKWAHRLSCVGLGMVCIRQPSILSRQPLPLHTILKPTTGRSCNQQPTVSFEKKGCRPCKVSDVFKGVLQLQRVCKEGVGRLERSLAVLMIRNSVGL